MLRFRHGLRLIHVRQRLIRAIGDADRYFLTLAQVALEHFFLLLIESQYTHGAYQDTGTAADAALLIDSNHAGLGVARERAGKAGPYAGGIVTVLAAYGKRDDTVFLNAEAGFRSRGFLLKYFNQVIGLRVMQLAVDFTESAADTNLLVNIDFFHNDLLTKGIR
jgi:hypothetical protein